MLASLYRESMKLFAGNVAFHQTQHDFFLKRCALPQSFGLTFNQHMIYLPTDLTGMLNH